ncbi:MAG: hypothetical protein HY042_10075, partial [Spirochaetia bacterium]|nr:hypothetical protein [Spirochaetia bacterium]
VTGAWQDFLRGTATYAMSRGKDRKRPNALFISQDVDDNGNSVGFEGEAAFLNRSFIFVASKFYAEGGSYYADATQFSHGFTGFKGDQAGGFLTQLNWGMYPASYTDDDGIDDLPYDTARKSGTDILHLGAAAGWRELLYFKVDWWRLRDTNRIQVFGSADGTMDKTVLIGLVSPTFPTRTTQMMAARRFGAPLGEEVDVGVDWFVTKTWKVWAVAGIFKPMRYYSVPGLRQFTPEGSSRFTGFQMGSQFVF